MPLDAISIPFPFHFHVHSIYSISIPFPLASIPTEQSENDGGKFWKELDRPWFLPNLENYMSSAGFFMNSSEHMSEFAELPFASPFLPLC